MKFATEVAVAVATCLTLASAVRTGHKGFRPGQKGPIPLGKRQLPAESVGIQSITSPAGVNITYKEPGKEGVCETTPGVNSYAGFVNLAPDVHSFVSTLHR